MPRLMLLSFLTSWLRDLPHRLVGSARLPPSDYGKLINELEGRQAETAPAPGRNSNISRRDGDEEKGFLEEIHHPSLPQNRMRQIERTPSRQHIRTERCGTRSSSGASPAAEGRALGHREESGSALTSKGLEMMNLWDGCRWGS